MHAPFRTTGVHGWIRTIGLSIISRKLYQLSYANIWYPEQESNLHKTLVRSQVPYPLGYRGI